MSWPLTNVSYTYMFRKLTMSSTHGSKAIAQSTSISLKILDKMEKIKKIIITIKDTDNSLYENELQQLNKMLYRSMDNLTEFELSLHQLKVSVPYTSPPINKIFICPACGKQWPHNHDTPDAYY